ncbi:TonB-dependent receptor domain-containing protein [Hephaestia mangrovi]|uniref:TonB-dependent receptor domain-containing protein n=1 Tax=Hephaestia mangrovi TaxID=2873268 RepID=UPI001CA6261F|nr:TonB-dependent receptor [Hephaestia mangrovi]MBY8829854.1 TonB-dependent receptor [Hephaestia mangrovi]
MKRQTACAVLALVAAGAGASGAYAQTTPAPTADSDRNVSVATASEPTSQTGEIVVTGSRISRRDYTSSSPIATVSSDYIAKSASPTLESSLNQLPQITSSASSSTNTQARGGQASLDLRGLGQQRTLILVDGRRVQPSASDGSVDLNTIPADLVQSVEIITGGASAVYGSDAVTGVVNLKLRQDVTGVELSAKTGVTERGDGSTYDLNLLAGGKFANGRGSALLSIGYSRRDIAPFTNRDYLRGQVLTASNPRTLLNVSAANLPSQAAVDSIFSAYGYAPGTVSRSLQLSFNRDGTLYSPTNIVNYRDGADPATVNYNGAQYYAVSETYVAQTPLTRYNVFGRVNYDFSDNIKLFVEGFYTNYNVTTGGAFANAGSTSSSVPITIPVTNPFIPADLRTYLLSRPNPTAPLTATRFTTEAGPRHERNDYDVFQLTTGLSGRFSGTDIDWSIVGSYGQTHQLQTETGYPSILAINQLLAAPDGGASLCSGGYNIFGLQPVSAACSAFISRTERNVTRLSQTNVEANVTGTLFSLPAGALKFAAGADYRQNDYSFDPDSQITTGQIANFLPIFASSGTTKAAEAYAELLIPVIKNGPLIKEFNLDASYRYSHYNTVGGISTYTVDADWIVIDGLRFRGGYSRATRAPSAGELFGATSFGQASIGAPGVLGSGDPCDVRGAYRAAGAANADQVRALCLAQGVPASLIDTFQNTNPRTPFQSGGNTALQPETADTYSAGVVLSPKFSSPLLEHLSLSVDYYNIKITKAIGQISSTVALSQCFSTVANPGLSNASSYCQLLQRNPGDGQLSLILNPQFNLANYSTSGIDAQLDWRLNLADVGGPGSSYFAISSVATYLDTFKIQNFAGAPTLDYAGTIGNTQIDLFADAHPRWKATSTATLGVGDVSASLRWRYIGKMANAANVGTNGTAPDVSAVSYFDLSLNFDVSHRFQLGLGATNIFDKKPPVVNTSIVGNLATDAYTYDVLGRRFYASIKAKF